MKEQSVPRETASGFSERDIEFLDRILQDLFGFGLRLEYCLSVLDDAPAQARAGMEGVVTGLSEMTVPIRDEIQKLSGSRKLSQEWERWEATCQNP